MKTVRWILVGCRIVALSCGLTLVGGGCGDTPTETSTPGLSPEEQKRNEDTQKAMQNASNKK